VGGVVTSARFQAASAGPRRARIRIWLVLLLVAGSAIRLGLLAVYSPVAYPDTESYMAVARSIVAGDFSQYEARRTPGYPLVLALAGLSPGRVWWLQSLMGLAISALLFYLVLSLTGRPGLAALGGMAYSLNLAQLFFEANLIAETTATLAITAVGVLCFIAYRRIRDGRRVWPWLLVLGLSAAFATLTRPQFVFLPVMIAATVGYAAFVRARLGWRSAGHVAVTFLTPVVAILGFCGFNYVTAGSFTLSTQTGIYLMDHAIAFIELAPDRYATIRDIYVRQRDEKLARRGLHNAVWEGLPEAMAATGLSLPAISREFARMSIEMFVRHPVRYARGVLQAWLEFWPAPIYWQPAMLRLPGAAPVLQRAWRLEQPVLRLMNAIFVGLVATVAISPTLRRRLHWDLELTTLSIIVLMTSVVQAVAIWAENARYAVPVQSLVVVVVLCTAARHGPSLLGRGVCALEDRQGRR